MLVEVIIITAYKITLKKLILNKRKDDELLQYHTIFLPVRPTIDEGQTQIIIGQVCDSDDLVNEL